MGNQERLDGPAFYALGTGAWRDYVTLLHPPYTLWHLSYVAIGAAVAPVLHLERLGASVLAFFLAMGIGAHSLDELRGRPLRTRVPGPVLAALAIGSIAGAVALGIIGALTITLTILPFIVFGVFIVLAYNMELFGGRFHSNAWFAFSWGAFPMLTSYWINSLEFKVSAVVVAVFCFATSLGQRHLSSQARFLRRRVGQMSGTLHMVDGSSLPLDRSVLLAATEPALKLMAVSMVLLALGLVAWRLT